MRKSKHLATRTVAVSAALETDMRKKGGFQNTKQIYAFLKARYGIPQPVLDNFRRVMAEDVVADGEGLAYDRVLTYFALAMNRRYGWEAKQIEEIFNDVFEIADAIGEGKTDMIAVAKELADNAGMIIRSDRDGVVGDYFTENEEDMN